MHIRPNVVVSVVVLIIGTALIGFAPNRALATDSSSLEVAESPIQVQANEREPNNSFATANVINFGDTVYGQFNSSGKDDYYKVSIPRSSSVTFTFANDRYFQATFGCDFSLRIYNQNYAQLFRMYSSTTTTAPKSRAYRLSAGVYYIKFEHDSWTNSPTEGHPYHFSTAYSRDMYRLYNPHSGEHFYTAVTAERDNLVKVGWRYEGIGWTAPATSTIPVYRLYNPNAGDHHYTMDSKEKDHLVQVGWRYEGVGWYSDELMTKPLYRAYNPNAIAGTHNYTTSWGEQSNLLRVGWRNEGKGWYGVE